jgi:hypothetical protein
VVTGPGSRGQAAGELDLLRRAADHPLVDRVRAAGVAGVDDAMRLERLGQRVPLDDALDPRGDPGVALHPLAVGLDAAGDLQVGVLLLLRPLAEGLVDELVELVGGVLGAGHGDLPVGPGPVGVRTAEGLASRGADEVGNAHLKALSQVLDEACGSGLSPPLGELLGRRRADGPPHGGHVDEAFPVVADLVAVVDEGDAGGLAGGKVLCLGHWPLRAGWKRGGSIAHGGLDSYP